MLLALMAVVVFATAVGAVYVPFAQTVKIILKNFGLIKNVEFQSGQESIIFYIRFPRVLVAVMVGAALATSGAVMQGIFRNPMADPGTLGVSSGASLGAVVAIALGLTTRSLYVMPVFAAAGALTVAFVIFVLSLRSGKISPLTLILSGIAVSMFVNAITSVVLSFARSDQIKEYIFWTTGGLGSRRWEHLAIGIGPILVCGALLFLFSRELNVLMLGEEEAYALGLDPSKARKIMLFLSSITTAAAVSVSGNISFVGLIVPHIMRLIVGPDHRALLPASAVGGALFLVLCDVVARTVIQPEEIGVGIITSLLGAPYFLSLLIKTRKEGALL
ncbi:iron ABC transporter [Clostridium thermosuccinogenes]|uniref:Iron ABC transporter n=2 Tax=Clostridium thermosuccinogenes TaxID=84032 RepID=A0A2K2FF74_9CLOT|nr:iron ABC transporter [Pseudoclostridium thermosuccinogenes]PNT96008.1 iron ABC transporter [Pseudoclostridium thermosuccinogenes]PNT97435.1 iron ABC transporter [Pseudoclostridium thermosuccinogenes]